MDVWKMQLKCIQCGQGWNAAERSSHGKVFTASQRRMSLFTHQEHIKHCLIYALEQKSVFFFGDDGLKVKNNTALRYTMHNEKLSYSKMAYSAEHGLSPKM